MCVRAELVCISTHPNSNSDCGFCCKQRDKDGVRQYLVRLTDDVGGTQPQRRTANVSQQWQHQDIAAGCVHNLLSV